MTARRRDWWRLACVAALGLLAGALWLRDWFPYAADLYRAAGPGEAGEVAGWRLQLLGMGQSPVVRAVVGQDVRSLEARPGFVIVVVELEVTSAAAAREGCDVALRTADGALYRASGTLTPRFACLAGSAGHQWQFFEVPQSRAASVLGLNVVPEKGNVDIVLRPPR